MKETIILIAVIILLIINLIIGGMNMAEQSYAYCGSKCKHPTYIKDDYAVIEGTLELVGNGGALITHTEISFPDNFNIENCIPLSVGFDRTDETSTEYGLGFGTSEYGEETITKGIIQHNILFKNENATDVNKFILETIFWSTETVNLKYKIVLFKYKD